MSYSTLATQSAGALCPRCGQPVLLDIEVKLHGSAYIERVYNTQGQLELALYYHYECIARA